MPKNGELIDAGLLNRSRQALAAASHGLSVPDQETCSMFISLPCIWLHLSSCESLRLDSFAAGSTFSRDASQGCSTSVSAASCTSTGEGLAEL